MEPNYTGTRSFSTGIIIACLPLTLFVINTLSLRFAGIGVSGGFSTAVLEESWLVFGLIFPLFFRLQKSVAFLRYFAFFALCALLANSLLMYATFSSAIFSQAFGMGLFMVLPFISKLVPILLILLSVRYLLNANLRGWAALRVLVVCLIGDFFLKEHFIISLNDFADNYIFLMILAASLVAELTFGLKKTPIVTIVLHAGILVSAFVVSQLLEEAGDSMTLKTGQAVKDKVTIPIDFEALGELSEPDNAERLKAYLSANPLWKVSGNKPIRAQRRQKMGEILSVANSFLVEGDSSFQADLILTEHNEKGDAFPAFDFQQEKYQDVASDADSVEALVFDSNFGKWDNLKEINLRIKADNSSLRVTEKSKLNYGKVLSDLLKDIRNELHQIKGLSIEAVQSKFAVKGEDAGKCYYRPPHKYRSMQVWGYLNGGEPGVVNIAVNGEAIGYGGERLGWSQDSSEGFYFEDDAYLRDELREVKEVEVRFAADSKNPYYSSSNYQVIARCERR